MVKQRKIVDIIKTLKRAPPDDKLQSTTIFNAIDIDDLRPSWVVAFGNAFDGIELHGPFDDEEKAQNYAEYVHKKTYADWNIVKLTLEE